MCCSIGDLDDDKNQNVTPENTRAHKKITTNLSNSTRSLKRECEL